MASPDLKPDIDRKIAHFIDDIGNGSLHIHLVLDPETWRGADLEDAFDVRLDFPLASTVSTDARNTSPQAANRSVSQRERVMRADWITEQVGNIRSLEGQTVSSLVAYEMAFRGGEGDGPSQFSDPALPFLQLGALYIHLGSGKTVKFETYQNDSNWGLILTSDFQPWELLSDARSRDSIFRTRELGSFPTGSVDAVNVTLDSDGDISEVLLDISGEAILLVAGEVYEQADGTFHVCIGDESVLLFREPSRKAELRFFSNR